MAADTVRSDFGAQENKICHCFYLFPFYLPWSDGIGFLDLSFWMLSFKPTFSPSSFTSIKRLFILFFWFLFIFIYYYYYFRLIIKKFFFTLQHCIGFAYIIMHPPWVYTCSPSWTPLPPPSPYHPSGSSQCTSPKLPVSCIEPGLATHFIHDILHVSMPFSQILWSYGLCGRGRGWEEWYFKL